MNKSNYTKVIIWVTIIALIIFGIIIKDFEDDKITYVLDAGLTQSRFISNQVRSEIERKVDKLLFYLRLKLRDAF